MTGHASRRRAVPLLALLALLVPLGAGGMAPAGSRAGGRNGTADLPDLATPDLNVRAMLLLLEDRRAYPVWNGSPLADHRAAAGLWAVEPHIGRAGVGVKFEELLVVTEDDAYWLDDHLLHAQRWAAAGYSIEPLGRV